MQGKCPLTQNNVCLSLAVMGRETSRFVEVTSRSSESPEHQLTLTVLREANLCFHSNSLFLS